jgi:hypothetical protein
MGGDLRRSPEKETTEQPRALALGTGYQGLPERSADETPSGGKTVAYRL